MNGSEINRLQPDIVGRRHGVEQKCFSQPTAVVTEYLASGHVDALGSELISVLKTVPLMAKARTKGRHSHVMACSDVVSVVDGRVL